MWGNDMGEHRMRIQNTEWGTSRQETVDGRMGAMRRLLGSVAGLMVLVAACGGAAPPAVSVAPAASASATQVNAKPSTEVASVAPGKPGQIVVAYSETLPGHAPLWAAKDGGIFEKNGLDIEPRLIESSLSIGALISGQAQLAQVGGSESLAAAVEGGDLKVLGIMGAVYSFKLEVAADIRKPEDLKGKKVGISRIGSSSD